MHPLCRLANQNFAFKFIQMVVGQVGLYGHATRTTPILFYILHPSCHNLFRSVDISLLVHIITAFHLGGGNFKGSQQMATTDTYGNAATCMQWLYHCNRLLNIRIHHELTN